MDSREAQDRFRKADKLFTYGRYEDVLVELEALEQHFPSNHRLLNAKARTFEQLGRLSESLAVCDRLLNEFRYEKIQPVRDRVAAALTRQNAAPQQAFWANEPAAEDAEEIPEAEDASNDAPAAERRFRIKPVRLALLAAVLAAMYFGYISYLTGGILIAGWFILVFLVKKLVGALFMRLFTTPFRMKGKALAGATCTVHGHAWAEKPADADGNGEDEDEDEDEDEGEGEGCNGAPDRPLRYVWIDVTITPQPRTSGFTHWEPGELMLAPLSMRYKGLDDMDKCFGVRDIKLVVDGQIQEEEGMKYHGPLRLRILAGVPEDESAFKFVYYFEQFGEIHLTP
ncbi:MAG: hypothetical protein KF886_06375 [Candidatus Hydrogenedentes bacterium]|nr:hypothetical protein [Candidatus Hydrogenedentota bacterium]